MNVKFSFDKAIAERRGFMLEDVHRTIKSLFAAHNFPCVSEGDVLSLYRQRPWRRLRRHVGYHPVPAALRLVHGVRRLVCLARRGR